MESIRHGDEVGARRVAMRILYDGTDFLGWQRQARGRTVQELLEGILSRLCGDRPVTVIGAGRTDSGVHASGQVAHADVATRYDDDELLYKLGRMLPDDLAVAALATVASDFHARYRACRRTYRYRIVRESDPFLHRYVWRLHFPLDEERLRSAAGALLGRRDFTTFSKHNPDTENPVCEIVRAEWIRTSQGLDFIVSADRFLYGMVRLLVGVQIDVARGRRNVEELASLIERRDRSLQSMAVPAHGLVLEEVLYPEPIFR